MKKQSILSSRATDTLYETHLINVPLDLFSPASKEQEYGSLDKRKRKQTTKIEDSASSAAQCANLSCICTYCDEATLEVLSIFGLVHTVTELRVCSLGRAAM